MKTLWQSIEKQLADIAPAALDSLNVGATEQDIAHLAQTLNATLPADFVESYTRHNGQNADSPWLMDGEELLSIERILEEWGVWKELLDNGTFYGDGEPYSSTPETGIRNDWWNPRWIPITYDGAGNHDCLDLDPAPEGNYGQIIRMWHDDDIRTIVAPSFREWLTRYRDKLCNGELVYDEEYGIVDKSAIDND